MKANFFTESILFWLVKKTSAAAQKLPPAWNVGVGAAAGLLFYCLLPGRRVTARDNLRAAFGSHYTPAEYDRMVRTLFENLGRMFMEVAAIPVINREYMDQWVRITPDSRERLEKALSGGKGVIFLAGHFGNWELNSITGALHGYPVLVLAREQGWPKLNRLLTEYRESKGCRVVTKGFPVRELIQGLKEGRIIGILADQDGGKHGVFAPFFGRLASTAPGTIALSLRTGAPVIPAFMVRLQGPLHNFIMEEPLQIPAHGTEEERIQAGVTAYLEVMEKYIRRFPTQWLWFHRRWKSSPERRILIFSDGKAGHLSQATALAQRLGTAWQERASRDRRLEGRTEPLVTAKTVQVVFRHPALRFLLDLVASIPPLRWIGSDFWLRMALTPESYRQFQSEHAHFSISCGSSTAAVNLLWARQISCKPLHILKSSFPSWRWFNLAVIPRHDLRGPNVPPKVMVVDGALVPWRTVTPEQAKSWSQLLKLAPGKKRIGLLLGGPAKGNDLDLGEVERMLTALLAAADKLDAELMVTTSRRTTSKMEIRLAERLGRHPRCRLLALVNQRRAGLLPDTATAVPCILELSDLLVVSGDSISMVSEAAATGKPVIVFPPKTKKPAKHHRFLRQMDESGRLQFVPAEQVAPAVLAAANGSGPRSASPAQPKDPALEFLRQWV
ncbi:MAG: ELM1/GtrOC1 family putative glycosyltransferase [Candidatus Omnitrophota bacterium]|nr:ELM1/GtrOC1 family putative glycosyltransferase [Candidatus Omnitrophota bacterium]